MTESVHANVRLLRDGLTLLTQGRIDEAAALLTDDFRINMHGVPEPLIGRDAWLSNARVMVGAFSEISARIEHVIADGDLVAISVEMTARHTGEFLGVAPTGRTVRYHSLEHYRFRDGLIAEEWIASDLQSLLTQLGVELPEPEQLDAEE